MEFTTHAPRLKRFPISHMVLPHLQTPRFIPNVSVDNKEYLAKIHVRGSASVQKRKEW